jgi:hypothetical protein
MRRLEDEAEDVQAVVAVDVPPPLPPPGLSNLASGVWRRLRPVTALPSRCQPALTGPYAREFGARNFLAASQDLSFVFDEVSAT